ncbi:MAG: 16S rRNA (cytosine(967)-C(5))-methyltransferase RsmB, partial [Peptoniphilus grossensis]
IKSLAEIQLEILDKAKDYVKNGGELLYSTCSLSKIENEDVVNKFLENNKNFKIKKLRDREVLKLFPSTDGSDGFSITLMEKN